MKKVINCCYAGSVVFKSSKIEPCGTTLPKTENSIEIFFIKILKGKIVATEILLVFFSDLI